ncbi:putative siderophore iron transporter mirb protein [Emericellopsis cladophorae]|uniref:Siderophore iron transporter mirb protein n=1 Tax=Emericellopsis cladophorae TaxID=2686198 RepID=A0A9Q0BCM0_9HYPO|nr:putative siderophore iron transporter mirb protein [Emericellopsis cladophorae]KAI6779254.1 putative siderophore iron transporter mirb protein [Emericellopsis cladophorae]
MSQPPVHIQTDSGSPALKDQHGDPVVVDASRDSNSAQDPDAFAGVDKEAQAGVQNVEAIATVWSTKSIIIAYALIWLVYFVMLLQQGAGNALKPYVTSAFQFHSLTPTVDILSFVISGCANLTVAKILDVWGRPQGYAVSLFIATIGLIMMAATTNVEMYAAAQVFWSVGTNALMYSINIFVADTTALHNRGLMTALTSSPNIITTWLGGPISEAFLLQGPGWRWYFGAFAIIVPVLCTPFVVLLLVNSFKAKRQGVIKKEETGKRSPWQTFIHYAREFDAVGLLLLTAGLAMFLLPFNIWAFQPKGWQSPLIICLLVFGLVLMVLFGVWERFFAPVQFIPYSLLSDRNMVGACGLGMVLFISYSCWTSYFSSFLQVVNGLSITHASYVVQIYSVGSSIFTIVTGVVIRYTGRYKAITLYGAIPVYTLFMGLMIYFRNADMDVGYIIMCQVFLAFAAGVMIITPPIAAMSSASHQHIAVVIAIVTMFSSIGGAVGLVVAGAIWQSIFPNRLLLYLPLEEQENFLNIYGMLEVQLSYPMGSPARIAIQRAYSDAQAMMLTAGTAIWVLGAVAVAFWRNTDIRTIQQVKGNII